MATKYDKHAIHALIDFNWTNLGKSLEFREDGIYVLPPQQRESLTDGELRHLVAHPKNDLGIPALPFPFTVAEFLAFCESAAIFDWAFVEAPYSNNDGTCDEEAIKRLGELSRPAVALVKARLFAEGEAQAGLVADAVRGMKGPKEGTTMPEKPKERRARRLARLRELGGDMRPAGTGWQTTGARGAMAQLARDEAAAGHRAARIGDVRRDLVTAASEQLSGK